MKSLAARLGHVDKSCFPYPIQLQHAEIGCSSHCCGGANRRDRKLNPYIALNCFTLRLLTATFNVLTSVNTEVLISPYPDQEGNKLQRQKILSFIYPIYNHNWRNIITIYINRGSQEECARLRENVP